MARIRSPQMLLLATAACLVSLASNASQNVQVLNENGIISVKATDVSASAIVEELTDRLGIHFVVTGNAETRLNLDIIEEPLDKVLPKLSPNNLIVRESADDSSQIIEVVLMLGDNNASDGNAVSEQFLPTGSPVEGITSQEGENQIQNNSDLANFRDPDRSLRVRQNADAAAYDASLPPDQVPPMFGDEQQQFLKEQLDQLSGVANAQ